MMKKLLQSIFCSRDISKNVSALIYSDKIIIQTNHQIKNSYWTQSSEVSLADINTDDNELGKILMEHLEKSKVIKEPGPEKRKELNEEYKIKTGLKTIKSQMKDSREVSVSLEKGILSFIPTDNGGTSGTNKGYRHKPEEKIETAVLNDLALIGTSLRKAFSLCR